MIGNGIGNSMHNISEYENILQERTQVHHTLNALEDLLEAVEYLEKYNLENVPNDHVILIDTDSEAEITRKQVVKKINYYKNRLLQLDTLREEVTMGHK